MDEKYGPVDSLDEAYEALENGEILYTTEKGGTWKRCILEEDLPNLIPFKDGFSKEGSYAPLQVRVGPDEFEDRDVHSLWFPDGRRWDAENGFTTDHPHVLDIFRGPDFSDGERGTIESLDAPTLMEHVEDIVDAPSNHAEEVHQLRDFKAALVEINEIYEQLGKLCDRNLLTGDEARRTERMLRATVEEKVLGHRDAGVSQEPATDG